MAQNLVALRDLILRHGLGEHADRIMRLARPTVRIRAKRVPEGATLPANASRFAGPASLPEGVDWPMAGEWAMLFLGQIRLSDAAPHDASGLLPKRGLLSLWYDLNNSPWGFDPKDRDGFRVMYFPDEDIALASRQSPARYDEYDEGEGFQACALSFEPSVTVPHADWSDFDDEREGLMELPGYEDLLNEIGQLDMPAHRLLGHPNLIQNPMEQECQLASNGVYCGGESVDEARCAELVPGIPDWRLLLQIDTDETDDGPGWMWGDCGMLYFWIREQDLKAARFDNCWMVLQCG